MKKKVRKKLFEKLLSSSLDHIPIFFLSWLLSKKIKKGKKERRKKKEKLFFSSKQFNDFKVNYGFE